MDRRRSASSLSRFTSPSRSARSTSSTVLLCRSTMRSAIVEIVTRPIALAASTTCSSWYFCAEIPCVSALVSLKCRNRRSS